MCTVKKLLAGIIVVILIAIGWIVFYIYPRNISIATKGVEYQLGKGSGHVIPVTLAVDGKLSHSLFGGKTFQVTIHISGASVPNPDNNRQLTVRFNKNDDYGAMVYGYWERNGVLAISYCLKVDGIKCPGFDACIDQSRKSAKTAKSSNALD
jgi:hypothetical protein